MTNFKKSTLSKLYIRTRTPSRYFMYSERRTYDRQHLIFHPIENYPRVMISSFLRFTSNRAEKARLVDKSIYPSDELVTARFSDTTSEQMPLHQTIAIEDAIDFVRDTLKDRNNFCWNGSWI